MGKTEGATVIERIDHLIAKIQWEQADIRASYAPVYEEDTTATDEEKRATARYLGLDKRLRTLSAIENKWFDRTK